MILNNVAIVNDNGRLRTEASQLQVTPASYIVIQTRFTLTGSLWDGWLDRAFGYKMALPMHQGYTSVGVVEEARSGSSLRKGDWVILPARYAGYTAFTQNEARELGIVKTQRREDVQTLLFAPLICAAMELAENVELQAESCVVVGGTVFAALVCDMLARRGISVTAMVGSAHMPLSVFHNHGASSVIQPEDARRQSYINGNMLTVVLDEPAFWELGLQAGAGTSFVYESALDKRMPLDCDSLREILDLADEGTLRLSDLVAQHTHLEYCASVYHAIEEGAFCGKAFVYDW